MSTIPDFHENLKVVLPHLGPFLSVVLLVATINLALSSFKGSSKVFIAALVGLPSLFASTWYLVSSGNENLHSFLRLFIELSFEEKFAIASVIVIVASLTTLLTSGEDKLEIPKSETSHKTSNSLTTPATLDASVDFEIPSTLPEDDKELFELLFDRFVSDIIADLPTIYELNPDAVAWTEKQLRYNAYGGKMNRGLSILSVTQEFAKANGRKLTNKERVQSAALGWCIELLQAFFLVADDIMDGSITRRGQPCWYKHPEVNLIAINDSFILESFVYKILKRYLGKETYYPQLLDLFIEVTRQTEFGQLLDLTSQPLNGPKDLSRFTMERYSSIVKYKTAFYSFYLPVALGMIVSGITDVKLYNKAREILMIMGEYFQVQDDYLDCYGAPEVIGKVGTDIEDNKCSWLVVQALTIADAKQRKILNDNYGQHDPKHVAKVKKLYNDLNIENVYLQYEDASYAKIKKLLAEVDQLPKEIFEFLLRKIYKRSK